MKLNALLNGFSLAIPQQHELEITGLTLDSRLVNPGDLFVACVGSQQDGRQYIPAAIAKGAAAILAEDSEQLRQQHFPVPIIFSKNLRQQVGLIAAQFYGHPSQKLRVIGVTGTNGKTSCCHFIAAGLQRQKIKCGLIGTLGNGFLGALSETNLTTPDAISLQKILADFVVQQARAVAMEVSSHSLDQDRANGIDFITGVFTNLTRDHLDYHGSMEAYGQAKQRLFAMASLKNAVINADDAFGAHLIQQFKANKNVFAYSLQKPVLNAGVTEIYAYNIALDLTGIHASVTTPWGTGDLHSPLLGKFNLSNLLAALTSLCIEGVPLAEVLAGFAELHPVSGRMQTFARKNQPLVVVDYAHTPDALEKTLQALRAHVPGKLWCLFGCGGDRDAGKRPLMAKAVEQNADQVWVTNDNPRHEDQAKIGADIFVGFTNPQAVRVEYDRRQAIREIIQAAGPGDCILVAGKGAEAYQQIGDEKLPFSDLEWVQTCLMSEES